MLLIMTITYILCLPDETLLFFVYNKICIYIFFSIEILTHRRALTILILAVKFLEVETFQHEEPEHLEGIICKE